MLRIIALCLEPRNAKNRRFFSDFIMKSAIINVKPMFANIGIDVLQLKRARKASLQL